MMDFIDPIMYIASEIYALVENVKANKKRCRRVSSRVKALDELVRSIRESDVAGASDSRTARNDGDNGDNRNNKDVGRALEELVITLKSAQQLIEKYTQANWMERIVKSSGHGDEFNSVNERLNDAFQILSGALQVEQGNTLRQVFEMTSRAKVDEVDWREDDAELKRMLHEYMKSQQEKMEAMQREFESVKTNVEYMVRMMNKPSITDKDIRMIKPEELKYDLPKRPFLATSTSEVYKGEYLGFTVVIKRYTDQVSASPRQIRSLFNKEVETMRRFESPNILRMFGICIQDENGPEPQFLIIMEYCEKGSLRDVLDSDCKLSWTRKARMSLDAAQGLYRLHQTEEKSKVHGCINSSKFLVAEGYRVKLGGLELAKTETSLKKITKDKKKEIRSLCYSSPQMLQDINLYNKECEIYSFGIILWEIATRRKPFEGCSGGEIYQKVYKERIKEPLPDDCPQQLAQLIDACRDYESFQRPSAGVLLDKLRTMVTQMEEQ